MAKRFSGTLTTTGAVMSALGGIDCVSKLTGSRYKATENWSRARTFPSRYFLVMTAALRRKRLSASPELWGMVIAPDQGRAAPVVASGEAAA